MKFTTTENAVYRTGVGSVPGPWIDYGLDHEKSIKKYFHDKIQIYDADECGEETHDFVFEDETAFRLEYFWNLNIYGKEDSKGNELPWVIDRHYIGEISIDDANVPEKKSGRDWM